MTQPNENFLLSISREFVLTSGTDGHVRWLDERARRLLGVEVGTQLRQLVSPGNEDKLSRMLAAPAADVAWELHLIVNGEPTLVELRAHAVGGEVLLQGSLVGHGHEQLLRQMSSAMSELSSLHRETERQQREIADRDRQVTNLRGELDDSGRGMAALYQELGDQTDSLRVATESRTRLIGNLSHELRTPLSSIIGLTRLLLARIDGDLSGEQEKQIGFIQRSADELLAMVNDLLDLSQASAGGMQLRPSTFQIEGLFGTLRGQLRPLATNPDVQLIFGPDGPFPALHSDEGKVAQVLRNLVTNAMKFTERGEVRVEAETREEGRIAFVVSDTGIGIAPADQARIFEEFEQLETPLHKNVKGSGLGLSLARRLAELLGGTLSVRSELGHGSTFTLDIPIVHADVEALERLEAQRENLDPSSAPVLVVEDDPRALFLYERYLAGSGFQVIPARSVEEAREVVKTIRPAAVVLDVMLERDTTWHFLAELKRDPDTCDIPTLVVTVTDREQKARALGADEFYVKPVEREWLLRKLRALANRRNLQRVLVIDDDEVARYVLRRLLAETDYQLLEAADGADGLRLAREQQPDVILLDFVLPSMTAFEVLDELKLDPQTRAIPVILSTSRQLDEDERRRLAADTAAIISKERLSREVAIMRIREALEKAIPARDTAVVGG